MERDNIFGKCILLAKERFASNLPLCWCWLMHTQKVPHCWLLQLDDLILNELKLALIIVNKLHFRCICTMGHVTENSEGEGDILWSANMVTIDVRSWDFIFLLEWNWDVRVLPFFFSPVEASKRFELGGVWRGEGREGGSEGVSQCVLAFLLRRTDIIKDSPCVLPPLSS